MNIELRLYASLSSHLPEATGENVGTVDLNEGTSIKTLLNQLNVPIDAVKVIFLNGVHTSGDEFKKGGEKVA